MFRLIVLNAENGKNDDKDNKFSAFKDIIKTHFLENYKINQDKLDTLLVNKKSDKNDKMIIHIGIYNMSIHIDYEYLKRKFQEIELH